MSKNYRFSKKYFNAQDAVACAEGFLHVAKQRFEDNVFLSDLVPLIKEQKRITEKSLMLSSTSKFTDILKKADEDFSRAFTGFTKMTRVKADLHLSRVESKAASKIDAVISKHGKDIHYLPRQKQIGQTNALITELEEPLNMKQLKIADLESVFTNMKNKHLILKRHYKERTQFESKGRDVPPAAKSGKVLKNYLAIMYRHIHDYAVLGIEKYAEAKNMLDVSLEKFIPIAKALITKRDNLKDSIAEDNSEGTEEEEIAGIEDVKTDDPNTA